MKVKVNTSANNKVVSVGIQGPPGPQGSITTQSDVDITNLENGSLLVYKAATNKWTSTTTLDLQNVEGGEF
jgi:hypothetical protein